MFRSRLSTIARGSIIRTSSSIGKVTQLIPISLSRLSIVNGYVSKNSSLIINNGINNGINRFYSSTPELTRDIIKERILEIFESFDKVKSNVEIKEDSNLQKDLGLDSLDLVDIIMAIEEEFSIEIPEQDAPNLKTVGDTIKYIENTPDAV